MKCEYPPETWKHHTVYTRVRRLLAHPGFMPQGRRIPKDFTRFLDPLDGLSGLNDTVGHMVESLATEALNRARKEWDPNGDYADYEFVLRKRKFPDVVLQHKRRRGKDILFGIELKSWNLLAKEGAPSFRFKASPEACAPGDLFACFPWVLEGFVGGKLRFFKPYVAPARFVASCRNHHWQCERDAASDASIPCAEGIAPYPETENQRVSEHPTYDGGQNFGRFARTGRMDDFMSQSLMEPLHGLPCGTWCDFFKICRWDPTKKAGTKDRKRMAQRASAMKGKMREGTTTHGANRRLAQGIERCLRAIEGGRSAEEALRTELKGWLRVHRLSPS